MRRVLVLLALATGCASEAVPADPNLVVEPLDLSASEPPSGPAPSDAGPFPPSCGFAADGGCSGPEATVEAGAYVASIGVGDLDGDGRLDLVTANRNDFVMSPSGGDVETISVILAAGAGTFRQQTKYQEPLYPQTVALGDFDRDGRLDVVTDTGTMLDVRLNLGAGKLGPPTGYADNTRGLTALAAVDVNGDGKLDLVTDSFPADVSAAHAIDIRLGRGDGTFGDVLTSPDAGGEYVAGGDFDEDGLADVVFASQQSRTFAIALGRPDGTVRTTGRWSLPGAPQGLAVGDIDGDGHLDIIVGGYGTLSTVVVARGDGRGGVDRMSTYVGGSSEHAFAIADFDRDGKTDVIVTDYWHNALLFFAGVGGGALADPVTLPYAIDGPEAISVGDFDRDGRPDIAVGASTSAVVTILFNRAP